MIGTKFRFYDFKIEQKMIYQEPWESKVTIFKKWENTPKCSPLMLNTGLKDKDGVDIFNKDITELKVDGEIRRFVVNIKTVIREVVSHPSFDDETAKVAITGVVFEWEDFELFPCVDQNGTPDNERMTVLGNIYEHSHLLEANQ